MSTHSDVVVVGGGPVGLAAALMLAGRGLAVEVHDKRPDPAAAGVAPGRSLHVVLSERGWRTLDTLSVAESVRELCLPLTARRIHHADGTSHREPYARDGRAIACVDRRRLHALLARLAAACPGIDLRWESALESIDDQGETLRFRTPGGTATRHPARWVGADGAFSVARGALPGPPAEPSWMDIRYVEVHFPAERADALGMDPGHFHVWPGGACFLSAFPNQDGSHTGSFFAPADGEGGFDQLADPAAFAEWIARRFPAFLPHADFLRAELLRSKPSGLATVHCPELVVGERGVLVGDAAHAVVPFFGQGMNCGFEDIHVLAGCLDGSTRWSDALTRYAADRRPDIDALARLSLAHFTCLGRLADPDTARIEAVQDVLDTLAPDRFRPLYESVAFTTVPYSVAERAEQERAVLARKIAARLGAEPVDAETVGAAWRRVEPERNEA